VAQPGLPPRLVAGLFILKHMHNLSDEVLCARWLENPYYQYFCGEQSFCHKLSFDRSSLTRWRQRLGEEQLAALIQESLSVAHKTGALETKDLERAVVDTTVQPKAVAHPRDARLMHRALVKLVGLARRHGLPLRQSYLRVAKRAAIMVGRYTHAHQFKRARARAQVPAHPFGCQRRSNSPHPPATAPKSGQFVLHAQALHGNPYDGHTLGPVITGLEALTGIETAASMSTRATAATTTRTSSVSGSAARYAASPPPPVARCAAGAAVEPVIGHLKAEHRMGSQLPHGTRRRSHQRRPRCRRLQLRTAAALAGGAFAGHRRGALPHASRPADRLNRAQTAFFMCGRPRLARRIRRVATGTRCGHVSGLASWSHDRWP
jgi:Transposase domain (DUF772)